MVRSAHLELAGYRVATNRGERPPIVAAWAATPAVEGRSPLFAAAVVAIRASWPRSRIRTAMRNSGATTDQHGPLLSVEQAAEYLGVSPGTLRNWLSARRIAYVKVGRLTRLSSETLDRFISEHTVTSIDEPRR